MLIRIILASLEEIDVKFFLDSGFVSVGNGKREKEYPIHRFGRPCVSNAKLFVKQFLKDVA